MSINTQNVFPSYISQRRLSMAPLSSKDPSFLTLFVVLCSFLIPSIVFATQPCNHHHFSALLHLKHSFHFSPKSLSTLSSWNSNNTDCCSWEGITCDGATGRVISLNLSSLRLSGRIDSESLFRLQSLQRLNLAHNYFEASPIPSGFDKLASLTHLNLSSLRFYGQIPLEISRLTGLLSLDLSYNYYYINDSTRVGLKLEIPSIGALVQNLSSLGEMYLDRVNISTQGSEWVQALLLSLPRLRKLSLQGCGLSGPILSPLSQLRFLSELDLSHNDLSYVVPNFTESLRKLSLQDCGLSSSIYSSLSQLQFLSELDLSSNNLSFVMPNFIQNFPFLRSLVLRDSRLHGKFPESTFQLPNLQILDMSGNPFLAGNLPEFPQKNTLQQLILSSTGFSGKLPDSLSNLKFLTQLALRNCSLSGSLPSSLSNLTKLQYLDLSYNRLSGPIPSSYGNELLNLKEIILSDNLLNGTIPSSLFSLPSLQWLDLGGNQLSGQLGEFHNGSSSQLAHIYLDNNNLQGMMPRFFFQLTRLRGLYVAFNNFSGVVELGLFQNLKNLYRLDLSDNNLSVRDGGGNSTFVSFPLIESLWLRSCNIRVFPNFLRNQEQLSKLDLSRNKISGEIPKWIWEVGNGALEYLNLSHNGLQGIEQPSSHLSSSSLRFLDLSHNILEGSLPIPSPSIFFSVSNNSLSGEIPPSVCNATFLMVLDLSHNFFVGQIPPCLGEIGHALSVLNLQRNAFNGTLLQTFEEGCYIKTLDLSENQLEGHVPRSLANCTRLEVLNFGNNRMHDTFPLWMEALPRLRVLILRSNQFHGTIGHPLTNHPFKLLQILDLSSNRFTGNLPSNMFKIWKGMMGEDKSQSLFLGKMIKGLMYYQDKVWLVNKGLRMEVVKILTAFTVVDLSDNEFYGDIPDSIGDLNLLHVLNMSNNYLTGRIPTSLQNLRHLESLDLSLNKLSGEIPLSLTELTFLEVLNFSQNLLMGIIPQSRQFLTFTNESFKGNLGLCGPPLSKKCEDAKGAPPFAPSTLYSERKYDLKSIWLGFGVGYGVGVGMLSWTLALWIKGRREFYTFIDRMLFLIFPSMVSSKQC